MEEVHFGDVAVVIVSLCAMKFCEEVGGEGWGCVKKGIVLILHGSFLNHMTTITEVGVSYVDHTTTITEVGVS